MIKLFRNNQPLNLLILLLVVAVLRGSVFFHTTANQLWLTAPLTKDLNGFMLSTFASTALVYKALSILLILVNGIYMNVILIKHNFFPRSSYMPALLYILLNSLYPTMLGYSPQLFAAFFLIVSIDKLFSMYDNENAVTKILDAGIFCGISALFSLDVLAFFPFIIYSILAIRPFNLREVILTFFGLITPFYVLAVVYFLKGDFETVKNGFAIREQVSQINTIPVVYENVLPVIIALPLMIVAGLAYQNEIGRNNVKTRKIQNVILVMTFFCILSAFFAKPDFVYSLPYFSIPCSIILSHYYLTEKRKGDLFKELSFLALSLLIIVLQLI